MKMKKQTWGSFSVEKLQTVSLWLTAIFAVIGFAVLALTGCKEPELSPTLESIAVKAPAKTAYAIGDALDTKGMVVTATTVTAQRRKLRAMNSAALIPKPWGKRPLQ